jgi:hypothetical protein
MANITSLEQYWQENCAEFETLTLKKKPVETIKKCWFRSNKTLTVTLREYDQALGAFNNGCQDLPNGKISLKQFQTLFQALEKKNASIKKMAPGYLSEIEDEIHARGVDAPTKDLYGRALKALRKNLEALLKVADAKVSESRYTLDNSGQIMNAYERAAALFASQMTASIAKGRAVTAKLKAAAAKASAPAEVQKLVTAYNAAIVQNAGRDINVLVVGIRDYCRKTPSAERFLPPVQTFYDFTKPWNEPNTHKLPGTASKDDVLAKLKLFNDMMKRAEIFAPRVMND